MCEKLGKSGDDLKLAIVLMAQIPSFKQYLKNPGVVILSADCDQESEK